MHTNNKLSELNNLLIEVSWNNTNFECYSPCTEPFVFTDEQKKLLDSILKNIPEWERMLNCKQHETHDYCLDLHTFSVIKKIKQNEDYLELDHDNKLKILYAALLHDIAKNESEVDPCHPAKSALKSCEILYGLGFSEEFIDTVNTIIKHHQLLGLMAAKRLDMPYEELASLVKTPINLELLAIMSIADIKSVKRNEAFYRPEIHKNIKIIRANTLEVFKDTDFSRGEVCSKKLL